MFFGEITIFIGSSRILRTTLKGIDTFDTSVLHTGDYTETRITGVLFYDQLLGYNIGDEGPLVRIMYSL